MIVIAHRGCYLGPDKRENSPDLVYEALSRGFHVEIDVWLADGSPFLGHDGPVYPVDLSFLQNSRFWCHAKNPEALRYLLKHGVRCFWHETDRHTLVSDGTVWCYPGSKVDGNSICVLPEHHPDDLSWMSAMGVCTDHAERYRAMYDERRDNSTRTALLLVGEPRCIDVCCDFLRERIIRPNDCDVFVVTCCSDSNHREAIRNKLLHSYSPKKVVFVQDSDKWLQYEKESENIARKKTRQRNCWSGIYQWVKTSICWQLMEDYEQRNGIRYERIVRTRTDFWTGRTVNMSSYDLDSVSCHAWEDIFAFGKREPMSVYCSLAEHYGEYRWNEANEKVLGYSDRQLEYIPEMQLRRHLHDNGVSYHLLTDLRPWVDMTIARSTDGTCGLFVPSWMNKQF